MMVAVIILLILFIVLVTLLYLLAGVFRVSVLDRRDRRKDELAVLSQSAKCGQTVFFGDSITHYCPVEEIYANYSERSGFRVYNRGIASETTEDALKRFDSNVLAIKPQNLVILLGCNDIGKKMTTEQTVHNIEEMIVRMRKVNPDVHIVLQAVYPIRETIKGLAARILIGSRTCEKVRALNIELKRLAKEAKVIYVDLTEILADESGQLKAEYTVDGLHVNERAYQQIAKKIIPLLEHVPEGKDDAE